MAERAAETIVNEFCEAWGRRDVAAIMAAFAEGATYHNIPMEPLVGKSDIEGFLTGFFESAASITFEIHHQATTSADGVDIVLNERTDTIDMGGNTVALPVMGTFVIRDGLIEAWRDYFDMAQFAGG